MNIIFLCSCPSYKTKRDKICNYIPNFKNLSPDDQFVLLMRFDSKLLAKYVESIWNKRKLLLNDETNV